MKKEIRELIKKLEMRTGMRDGKRVIEIDKKNAPNAKEVSFIKANREEIIKELLAIREEKEEQKRLEKLQAKERNIKIVWKDGEYLSDYMVIQNSELIEDLGLGKYILGWGVKVSKELVDALGKEFTATQAREYARPILEEKAAKKAKKEIEKTERLEELKAQAKVLGHKVEVRTYNAPCDGTVSECDLDIVTEWIDGKGNITKTRTHTH